MIDVSVVVPFWNAERFLREAIASVHAQTTDRWELLLIDDGSADESTRIARAEASAEPQRARYLEHEGHRNLGPSAARNLGLREARGRHVTFLDADDVLLPDALATQAALLDGRPEVAMVYGPIHWWYGWTGVPADARHDFVETTPVPAETVVRPPWLFARFVTGRARVPSKLMVRAAIAREVGGFDAHFRGLYEDQVFCAKICLRYPVHVAGRSFYRYRQHPDSRSSEVTRRGALAEAHQEFLQWLTGYVEREGLSRPSIRWAIWRAWLPYRHPGLYRLCRGGKRFARRLLASERGHGPLPTAT
jgi:glycosyltransferase involved in cell wall biosynthesis